jgi:hypothetical protein
MNEPYTAREAKMKTEKDELEKEVIRLRLINETQANRVEELKQYEDKVKDLIPIRCVSEYASFDTAHNCKAKFYAEIIK